MCHHLDISAQERQKIEVLTREQATEKEWHSVRSRRITGSICGRIINQKKRSIALLRSCLYPMPLVPVPKPIYYGRKMEPIAIRRYESEMKSVIGKTVSVNKCAFIIISV